MTHMHMPCEYESIGEHFTLSNQPICTHFVHMDHMATIYAYHRYMRSYGKRLCFPYGPYAHVMSIWVDWIAFLSPINPYAQGCAYGPYGNHRCLPYVHEIIWQASMLAI